MPMDRDRMPHSFPTRDLGAPTPGTTSLHEPPEGALLAPPALPDAMDPPVNGTDTNSTLPTFMDYFLKSMTDIERTAYRQTSAFCNTLDVVLRQATFLRDSLLSDANNRGGPFIRSAVIHVTLVERTASLEDRYRRAQVNCIRRYAMSTLDTHLGQLEIEGHVPKTAVLDTRAGTIIQGKSFAAKLLKCSDALLEPSTTFVTASGSEELGVRKTTMLLTFTLAKGARFPIRHDFSGSTFGYVDPLTEQFF